ncbi:MAG: hypothetical protein OXP07_11950, partial [Defluviicoccus sp.]|nr:hypothetical protein [Defluviicoccus sp.]
MRICIGASLAAAILGAPGRAWNRAWLASGSEFRHTCARESARMTNPLFNDNRMKLGIIAM